MIRWGNPYVLSSSLMAGLHQSLSQSQSLAPHIRQSLEILQASTLELNQLVQQSIQFNPVLDDDSESISLQELEKEQSDENKDAVSQENYEDLRELAIIENRSVGTASDAQEKRDYMMNSLVGAKTLQQHLLDQLDISLARDEVRDAARLLVGDINQKGYLESPLSQLAVIFLLPFELLEEARNLLQRFDPVGVAAQDLKECLLIQLERKQLQDSLEYEIVRLHMDALARKHFSQIAKATKTSEEDVKDAARHIAMLDPAPGSSFDGTNNPIVLPDLCFDKDDDGQWHASLTNEYLPKIKINDTYKSMLSTGRDKNLQNYLRRQIQEGRYLIKALDQRQETIIAIGEEIILKQIDFLEKGISHLHPLTMNDIADKIGIHATTVSRAVHAKYVRTPHGVIELRRFFSSGYTKKSGETVSNSGVRDTLQKIIEGEDKTKPLSDSAIEKLLKEKGLKVARRTIAKYREQLGILPSHLRKGF